MKRLITVSITCILLVLLSVVTYATQVGAYNEKAYQKLVSGLENVQTTIDLQGCGLKTNEIASLYERVRDYNPQLFYISTRINYEYDSSGNIKSITPSYSMPLRDIPNAKKSYQAQIDYMTSLFDSKMSEAEKALIVHDYLCSTYSYDTSMSNYDVYSMIDSRQGVCQSYALYFISAMKKVGIEACMVSSHTMSHAWIQVKIDGEWYNIDFTADDPKPDRTGYAKHDYFLVSDNYIRNAKFAHYDWKSDHTCTSEKYANIFLKASNSSAAYYDGYWYYMDESKNSLMKTTFEGGANQAIAIYTYTEKWAFDANSWWPGIYSGVSQYKGYIIFNTATGIYTYNTATGAVSLYRNNLSNHNIYGTAVIGTVVINGKVEYQTGATPNEAGTVKSIDLVLPDLYASKQETTPTYNETVETPAKSVQKSSLPFSDVAANSKYYDDIAYVYENKIFNGVSENEFAPGASLTRGMFVTVLGRLCGVDTTKYTKVSFVDCEAGSWYAPYVEWAASNGLVNGTGNNCFSPNAPLTNEQMCKIIADCAAYLGIDVKTPATEIKGVASWAQKGVSFCNDYKLIDSSFTVSDNATRGGTARMLHLFGTNILKK